jgi:hypothetical protein
MKIAVIYQSRAGKRAAFRQVSAEKPYRVWRRKIARFAYREANRGGERVCPQSFG